MNPEREVWIRELMRRFREAARQPEMKTHAGYYSFRVARVHGRRMLSATFWLKEPEADWNIVNAGGPSALQGHDWLESIGLAVDITADQFPDYEPCVMPVPAPLPPEYTPKQRIELDEWHLPHEAALRAVRSLTEKSDIDKSGG